MQAMAMECLVQDKGSGKGQGSGFQLPDIIQKQKSLGQQMQDGMSEGNEKKNTGKANKEMKAIR